MIEYCLTWSWFTERYWWVRVGLEIYFCNFMAIVCVMWRHTMVCVEVREQHCMAGSLLTPVYVIWRSDSGHQAQPPSTLPAKAAHWLCLEVYSMAFQYSICPDLPKHEQVASQSWCHSQQLLTLLHWIISWHIELYLLNCFFLDTWS